MPCDISLSIYSIKLQPAIREQGEMQRHRFKTKSENYFLEGLHVEYDREVQSIKHNSAHALST